MHYNVYEGMQNTWSDRFGSVTSRVTHHNWLPAAVGCLVVLWVGLLLAAVNQTGPANPGAPSNVGVSKSTPAMTVTSKSDTTEVTAAASSTTPTATASTAAVQSAAQPAYAMQPAATDTSSNVVGGRGADAPAASADGTGTNATDTTTGLDLSVQTPLTPDPINVGLDLNSGLQVNLGL
jgi:cytoskeletal protein RodZ